MSNYLANCGGAKPSENKGTNIKDLLAKVRPGIRAPTSKRKQKKKIAEPVHQ